MIRKRITLSILFQIFVVVHLLASGAILDYGIRPNGRILELRGNPQELYGKIFTAFDAEQNRYFIRVINEIYTYDFPSNTWDLYLKMDELLDQELRMDYSPYHKGLLFWDAGVGRVFLLDSTKTFSRIDNSFNHRNQYGHGWWINPETGSIKTFGGYGLFTLKSNITEFNPVLREWNDFIYTNFPNAPAPQIEPLIFPAVNRNKIYMLGKKLTNAEWHADPNNSQSREIGFWEFDLNSRSWTYLSDLDLGLNSQLSIYQRLNRTHYNVHPRLPILLFATNDEVTFSKRFQFFDFDRRLTHLVKDVFPELDDPYYHLSINWSNTDNAYQILALDWNFNSQILRIIPMELRINDEEAFAEWLSESQESSNISLFIILSIFSLVPILFFRFKRKYRVSDVIHTSNTKLLDPIKLITESSSIIKIEYKNNPISDIQGSELKLLSVLAQSLIQSGLFVTNEQIEQELLPNHPSTDYTRRYRNLTVERLETNLKAINPDSKEDFIIKRQVASDKRKFEYRLNERLFELVLS